MLTSVAPFSSEALNRTTGRCSDSAIGQRTIGPAQRSGEVVLIIAVLRQRRHHSAVVLARRQLLQDRLQLRRVVAHGVLLLALPVQSGDQDQRLGAFLGGRAAASHLRPWVRASSSSPASQAARAAVARSWTSSHSSSRPVSASTSAW